MRWFAAAAALCWSAAFWLGCAADLGLDRPRTYPCDPDAGAAACAPGWRCGLERTCHAQDAGAPYLCRSDADCELDWRCGLEGRCHARVPGPYLCGSDADCEGGWRCGLEGVCHDPGVAAAYQCRSDLDCEQGWRCGPAGLCLDASGDALRRTALAGPLAGSRLSPQLQLSASDLLSFNSNGDLPQAFDVVRNGALTHVEHDPAGMALRDGGRGLVATAQVALPGGIQVQTALTLGRRTYLLHAGGIDRYTFDLDGGVYSPFSLTTGTELRMTGGYLNGSSASADRLIVLGGNRYTVLDPTTAALIASGSIVVAGSTQTINDLVGFPFDPTLAYGYLMAATDQGPFITYDSAGRYGPWNPVDLPWVPNSSCPGGLTDGGLQVLRLRGQASTVVGLEAAPRGATGPDRWGILLTYFGTQVPSNCPIPTNGNILAPVGTPCQLCLPGETLVDFGVEQSRQSFNVRCRSMGPGGQPLERADSIYPGSGCSRQPASPYSYGGVPSSIFQDAVVVPPPPFVEGSGLGMGRYGYGWGYLGQHGTLWSAALGGATGLNRTALTLDTSPEAVVGQGAALQARATTNSVSTARLVPGMGLVTSTQAAGVSELVTGVEGQPDWSVLARLSPLGGYTLEAWTAPSGGQRLASSALTQTGPPGPYRALETALPDGGTALVVSAFDALMGADVTAGTGAALEVRDVPNPRNAILSITALSPPPALDGGAPLLFGYALTPNRLYSFAALAPLRWRTDPVQVPLAEWVKVWADGPRGRLGYRDGQVYSLPSGVPIAGPLPRGQAVDFAQLCGQAFALGTDNLYRLVPAANGGVVGQWQVEDITPWLPASSPDLALAGGRLYAAGSELDVFTAFGSAVRLQGGPCP